MDVRQATLFEAEFLSVAPYALRDISMIIHGSIEFEKLGQVARCQSVQRRLEYLYRWEADFMKKQGQTMPKQHVSGQIAWVNYKLTEAEKEQFSSWDAEDKEVAGAIVSLISEGYRFNVNFDNYNKAIQVTCIAPVENGPNAGRGFSSYAGTWEKAWALCVFKHFSLWGGTWPTVQPPTPRGDFG